MPCMCGDVMCPSCGPAQGYNPSFEQACEWIDEVLLADLPPGIDKAWLVEDLAGRMGKFDSLVDAVETEAHNWARANRSRR